MHTIEIISRYLRKSETHTGPVKTNYQLTHPKTDISSHLDRSCDPSLKPNIHRTLMKKRKALLSVFDDDKGEKLVEFAKALIELGFDIISSGGTFKFLKAAGIEVTDVETITGYPPVLKHKVVTLAAPLHGGLLASADQAQELEKLNWPKIDLLLVTFYPLERAMSADGATLDSCLMSCDIGGPTMIRSANKGGEVIVLTSMKQTTPAVEWIKKGEPDRRTVLDVLRGKAERTVAEYIKLSADVHSEHTDLHAAVQHGL